jgi:hypothetical protein
MVLLSIELVSKETIMNKNTLVINLWGGPGSGKSSLMAGLFSALKFNGCDCEMAPEFAKEKVWENSLDVLSNQIYVFGKQHHAIFRLKGKVDIIITDSPLLFSLYYGANQSLSFKQLVLEEYNKLNNLNVWVDRVKKYNPNGRLQTEDEALEIDNKLLEILHLNNIKYIHVPGKASSISKLLEGIDLIYYNEKR